MRPGVQAGRDARVELGPTGEADPPGQLPDAVVDEELRHLLGLAEVQQLRVAVDQPLEALGEEPLERIHAVAHACLPVVPVDDPGGIHRGPAKSVPTV